MNFTFSTLLFCLVLLVLSAVFAFGTRRWPNLWRTLPRQRILGGIMGFACLAWSAAYAMPMFEGPTSPIRLYIKILVPVIAILSYFFLSYIFTRALGGLLVLGVTHLLGAAFVANPGGRAVFALLCYAFAVYGLTIIVFPWIFRDMLEKAAQSRRWRYAPASLITTLAAVMAVIALIP